MTNTQPNNVQEVLSTETKVNNRKIKGQISLIAERHSIFLGVKNDLSVVDSASSYRVLTDRDDVEALVLSNSIRLVIRESNNVNSKHYNVEAGNSSNNVRKIVGIKRTVQVQRPVNTMYGLDMYSEEKEAFVDMYEYQVKVSALIRDTGLFADNKPRSVQGFNELLAEKTELDAWNNQKGFLAMFAESIHADKFMNSLRSAVVIREEDLLCEVFVQDLGGLMKANDPRLNAMPIKTLQLGYQTVGQQRQGNANYNVKFDLTNQSNCMRRLTMLTSLGFHLSGFDKGNDETSKFDMTKIISRFRLNNASSVDSSLLDGFGKATKTQRTFKRTIPVLENNVKCVGTTEEDTIVDYWTGENGMVMALSPDFSTFHKQTLKVSRFHNSGSVDIVDHTLFIEKNATDGYVLIDSKIAQLLSEEFGQQFGGFQFRMASFMKGLMIPIEGLRAATGADFWMFEGSRKADSSYWLENGLMDLSILNFSREPQFEETTRIARQAWINLASNLETTNAIFDTAKEYWDKAIEFDTVALKGLIGASELNSNNEVEYEEFINSLMDSGDSKTVQLLKANTDLTLASAATRKKVKSLLMSVMKSFVNGHAYAQNSATRHMAVDPIGVLSYLANGYLSAVEGYNMKGIKPENVVVSKRSEKGGYEMTNGEAVLIRYPNLEKKEIRKVNQTNSEFFGNFAKLYTSQIRKGYFKGLILFSLWDMNPEAMSGADFDGDRAVVINDPAIVSNFVQQPLFLDYSLVEQEDNSFKLVDGCPFSGTPNTKTVFDLLPTGYHAAAKQFNMRMEGNTLLMDKSAVTEQHDNALQTMIPIFEYFILRNLKGNDIGKFTNILATVTAAKSEAMGTLKTAQLAMNRVRLALEEQGATPQLVNDLRVATEITETFNREVEGFQNLEFYLACAIRWEIDAAKHGGAYKNRMPFLEALEGHLKGDADGRPEGIYALEEQFGISLARLFTTV